jgi:hypothetical protein
MSAWLPEHFFSEKLRIYYVHRVVLDESFFAWKKIRWTNAGIQFLDFWVSWHKEMAILYSLPGSAD